MSQKTKKVSENNYEGNVRQLMYLGTCGLFKELQKHLTGVWAWDLHTTFLKENTKEGSKIRDVPYFLPFLMFLFEMAWITQQCSFHTGSQMSSSPLFFSHPSNLKPLLAFICLFFSTSSFDWLSIAPCLHSQPALVVHHARQPLERRRGRVIAFMLV